MLSLPSPLQSGVRPDELPPHMELEHSHSVVENQQQWSPFKRWYMRHWATPAAEERQAWIQTRGPPMLQKALTIYFQIWSWPGESAYVILFAFVTVVCGFMDKHGLAFLLATVVSIATTGFMKDRGECPRPNAPPVHRHFRVVHVDEFGFPSTHSALA